MESRQREVGKAGSAGTNQAAEAADIAKPLCVVGIGASAGGLEALEQFFDAMPPDAGIAFVVVQHLSPDFRSLMDELLAHRTPMPIHRVEDGMRVEGGAIYLNPPKKEMIISGGKLLLTDKDPQQGLTLPIDHFFRSLAQDAGQAAAAIVLSGTGSDGSRGIRDVHEAGGLVIAQSLESARFDGMPKSAIDTGVVDLVLAPAEMPAALLKYVQHSLAGALVDEEQPAAVEGGMTQLYSLLREEYGIDFSHYKPSTVCRRVERRLLMHHTAELDEYIHQLRRDPEELNALYRDLLIGVTKFFRDREAFERLRTDVFPQMLLRAHPQEELRMWVAGCATGEEAYSLAILLDELMATHQRPVSVKIFATDVHRASIDFASAGVYPVESLSSVDPPRLVRYFTRHGNGYQVAPELRQMIVFAHHNIIKDAPFTKLDLISCRNLLIYLQPPAQKKALSLFHFGLKTGGVLFLGPSESPAELGDEFDAIDLHWKIFRKRRDIRLPADLRLPYSTGPIINRPQTGGAGGRGDGLLSATYDALLAAYLPASVLIDERREVLHTFGGAEKFLRIRGGKTSTNLLDLLDDDLRVALSGALNRALKEQAPVSYSGIRVKVDGSDVRVRLGVRPIPHRAANTTHMLVSLEEETVPDAAPERVAGGETVPLDLDQAARDRLAALENELRYTKENLQATVEELETSNEELQAANEELVASNEELQSTNEELHSVNEELYTVNAEYQRKINELTQLNNDMDNLLRSTQIGTVFLDRELRIRKFTPQIARLFHLLPQDVGRRIDTFTHSIDDPRLPAEISEVIAREMTIEREVQDRQGNWYFLRILPYSATTGGVEGAVLTLVDISALKVAQSQLQDVDRQLRGILDNSATFLYVKDLEGRYRLCNAVSQRVLGAEPEQLVGKTDYELLPTAVADVVQEHDRQVATCGRVIEFEERFPRPEGERIYLSVKFPLRDAAGRIYAVGAVCTEVTDLKRAEEEQRLAVIRRDQFLAMLSHELRNPLGAITSALAVMEHSTDPAIVARTRGVIERQTRQMIRLLDDLLDVSRVTQNKIELRKEVVDLRRTTQDAVDAVMPQIEARRQHFSLTLPDEPLVVEGDPARLQQIQTNLLTNASKYTPAGGHIELVLERHRRRAVIRVRDDGMGIPPELQQSIFDLFVQSHTTIDRADGGMGVGLTLVRSIVEKHHGQIEVHSEGLGRGSEFIVRLPLTSRRLLRQSTHAPPPPPPPSATLLLIEDNADARETLQMLLQLEGYRVIAAADGEAGWEALAQERPAAALVDIGLPKLNGYELARRVRANAAYDSVCLIALTGYGQSSDQRAALEAGFDAHLVKPLNTGELARLLAQHLPRRASAR